MKSNNPVTYSCRVGQSVFNASVEGTLLIGKLSSGACSFSISVLGYNPVTQNYLMNDLTENTALLVQLDTVTKRWDLKNSKTNEVFKPLVTDTEHIVSIIKQAHRQDESIIYLDSNLTSGTQDTIIVIQDDVRSSSNFTYPLSVATDKNLTSLYNKITKEQEIQKRIEITKIELKKKIYTINQIRKLCDAFPSDEERFYFLMSIKSLIKDSANFVTLADVFKSTKTTHQFQYINQ
ncbi:MAG: DUF4476 domain-containing protein [Phycisphaerales bacterium]|nr:DUF4476 domain-containing protein [Phycisphaerales bacterium]